MKLKKLLSGWEVLVILLAMLFVNGAFFSEDLIGFAIASSIVILLTVLYRAIAKTEGVQLNWLTVICWGVAFSYGLTLWTTVTVEGSLLKMLEWFTYGLLLLFVRKDYYLHASTVIRLFALSFCVLHLLFLTNIFSIAQGFLYVQQGLSVSGVRLNGLLQYANATGALAAALLLYTLFAHLEKQRWAYVDMLLLTTLAYLLWLTESRGALLVLGISFVIGLLFMKQQLHYFLLFLTALLTGLVAYVVVLLVAGFAGYSLALLVVVAASFIIERFSSKWSITLPLWLIPTVIIVLLTAFFVVLQQQVLPQALQNRLTFTTLQARFVYMQDALVALKEFWLMGAGGDAWKFVVYQYQSTGYVANDIHMFWEQHWLETGLFGIVLITGACLVGLVLVFKQMRGLVPVLVLLLLHSCIDFTLSYGVVIFFVLLLMFEGMQKRAFITRGVKWAVLPISVVACSVMICATIWQQGEKAFEHYLSTSEQRYLQQAIAKNPYATRFYEAQAAITEPLAQYEQILRYEPRHAKYWFYAAQIYFEQGDANKALSYLEKSLTYDRFDWTKYKLADEMLTKLGTKEARALNTQFKEQKATMKQLAKTSKLKNQERENILRNN